MQNNLLILNYCHNINRYIFVIKLFVSIDSVGGWQKYEFFVPPPKNMLFYSLNWSIISIMQTFKVVENVKKSRIFKMMLERWYIA